MMIEPPIDELVKKTNGNKYKLSCILAKRAKELEIRIPAEIEASDKKAISIAAEEIVNGEIVPSDQQTEDSIPKTQPFFDLSLEETKPE